MFSEMFCHILHNDTEKVIAEGLTQREREGVGRGRVGIYFLDTYFYLL